MTPLGDLVLFLRDECGLTSGRAQNVVAKLVSNHGVVLRAFSGEPMVGVTLLGQRLDGWYVPSNGGDDPDPSLPGDAG